MWRSYVIGLGFLVIYLMTTFRYLAPLVHYQLDYTYISQVLCMNRAEPELGCHGKCQLRKELNRLNQTQEQKMQQLVSAFHPVEDVPQRLLLLPVQVPELTAAPPILPAPGISKAILPTPFQPPRQV